MNLDLVGRLTLFPGRPLPSIGSTRLSWVPRLARGRQADDWPAIAASLFTLCGTAHRMCAARAVAAAERAFHGDGGSGCNGGDWD